MSHEQQTIDFSLRKLEGRWSEAKKCVGYSIMIFHMKIPKTQRDYRLKKSGKFFQRTQNRTELDGEP